MMQDLLKAGAESIHAVTDATPSESIRPIDMREHLVYGSPCHGNPIGVSQKAIRRMGQGRASCHKIQATVRQLLRDLAEGSGTFSYKWMDSPSIAVGRKVAYAGKSRRNGETTVVRVDLVLWPA